MRLEIPYFSQYLDVSDPYWSERSCAIACVAMVLKTSAPIDRLVKECAEKYGYNPELGWTHAEIVSLFADHSVRAERKEFKREGKFDDGVREIVASLDAGHPVMISTIKNWSEEKKFHVVLFVGYEKEGEKITGFYYHDPAFREKKEGENRFVPFEIFEKHWRRLAIFPKA